MSFKMKRTLEMRRVESAFADYLENEDSIDLLWSDKVGYLLLTQPIHTKCGRLLLRMILNHAIHDGII